MLLDGGRGGGKTWVAVETAVKHCYFCRNATVLVMAIVKSAGEIGGVWHKLISLERDGKDRPLGVLQQWREEVGLMASDVRQDQSRNFFVEIKNQYGEINRIYYKSLPPGSLISERIKGIEFSLAIVDEIGETDNPDYLLKLVQQMGRKPGVGYWTDEERAEWVQAPQQIILCTNPPDEGPDHWLFRYLAQRIPENEGRDPLGIKEGDEGIWTHNDDPRIARYSLHMNDNHWLENKEGYLQNVLMSTVSDSTASDRLVEGLWRRKIEGLGIFQGFWTPAIHVPNMNSDRILAPVEGWPIIVGWDPGEGNIVRAFMQRLYAEEKKLTYWLYFDAVKDLDSRLTYEDIVAACFDRLVWWNKRCDTIFPIVHIGDDQPFKKWVNESGSLEYQAYQKTSQTLIDRVKSYKDLKPIRFRAPSKSPGSVASRVRLFRNHMLQETLMVCRTCKPVVDMCAQLKKETVKGMEHDFKPKKDGKGHIHTFDACTYPMQYFEENQRAPEDLEDSGLAFTSHRL